MANRILKTNELQIIRSHGTADAMRLTGLTRSQVKSARNRYRIKSPAKPGRHPKLYAEDIAQMMMLRCSGFSNYAIGEMKGCSEAGVRNALRNAEQHGFNKYPPRGRV